MNVFYGVMKKVPVDKNQCFVTANSFCLNAESFPSNYEHNNNDNNNNFTTHNKSLFCMIQRVIS